MLLMGLVTAVEGAVGLLNMFHLETFSFTWPCTVGGWITTGSLTVYYLMFSVFMS